MKELKLACKVSCVQYLDRVQEEEHAVSRIRVLTDHCSWADGKSASSGSDCLSNANADAPATL